MESMALAVFERCEGQVPTVGEQVMEALMDVSRFQQRCPSGSRAQCWQHRLALPVFGGDVSKGRAALDWLAQREVHVRGVEMSLHCARSLNDALGTQKKSTVHLSLFEHVLLRLRGRAGDDVMADCGMVGGIRDYPKFVQRWSAQDMVLLRAKKGVRHYRVPEVGQVHFEVGADNRHVLVSLASMVGKYVRELWMLRQNRFYQAQDRYLASVSGYHDPKTRSFVGATGALRQKLGVDERCFTRDR